MLKVRFLPKYSSDGRVSTLVLLLITFLGNPILSPGMETNRGGSSTLTEGGVADEARDVDVWANLNDDFQSVYSLARTESVLSSMGADSNCYLIVVDGGTATLIGNLRSWDEENNSFVYTTIDKKKVITDYYTRLKQVSHIPVTSYLHLHNGYLPQNKENIVQLLKKIKDGSGLIKDHFSDSEDLSRNEKIFSETKKFLEYVLREKPSGGKLFQKMHDFTYSIQPLIEANILKASRAYIDSLHSITKGWIEERAKGKFKFVALTEHMPRERNIVVQYFLSALNRPNAYNTLGRDIIVCENIKSVNEAIRLLGTHLIDFKLGYYFFDNGQFMHSDIQANSAEIVIKEFMGKGWLPLFPKKSKLFAPSDGSDAVMSSSGAGRARCPFASAGA
eukprot:Nk52_evm35s252 gene=Nk52_evmTU35s252